MAKYDFTNYKKFLEFRDELPEGHRACFQALVDKSRLLVAKISLQALVDTADAASRGMADGWRCYEERLIVTILRFS